MVAYQPAEPLIQRGRSDPITAADDLDASSDFSNHEHAQAQVDVLDGREPRGDVRVASAALAQLREDVGVEEVGHNRTGRARRRFRAKSLSVPASGIRRSHSLRVVVPAGGRRAARKISRCSASIECPRRAARVRRAATTAGSSLRTTSWDSRFRFIAINDSTAAREHQ